MPVARPVVLELLEADRVLAVLVQRSDHGSMLIANLEVVADVDAADVQNCGVRGGS